MVNKLNNLISNYIKGYLKYQLAKMHTLFLNSRYGYYVTSNHKGSISFSKGSNCVCDGRTTTSMSTYPSLIHIRVLHLDILQVLYKPPGRLT
jgi:hypothetical protein